MITIGDTPEERVYIVDGELIIESTHSFSEVYLVPELATQLSADSASSSICAETGAPELRHYHVSNSFTSIIENEEKKDTACPAIHGHRCPHNMQSTLRHDRNGCEIILNADDSNRSDDADIPNFISPLANVEEVPHNGSMGASSITLSDAFSIDHRMFDFSQRFMPESIPRRRRRQRNLSIIATTPSRYQRPVDSLLISHKHPSPIYTNVTCSEQQQGRNEPQSIDSFCYENRDPQSPSVARRHNHMKEHVLESKRKFVPKREQKAPQSPVLHATNRG